MRTPSPCYLLFVLAFLILAGAPVYPAFSQSSPLRHLNETHALVKYKDRAAWLGRAAWLRAQIRISNGLWPAPEKTNLNPQFTDATAFDGYTVQGVMLETLPGFFLPGTLYKPDGEGPFPAILSAHGHWSTGRFEHTDLASVPGRAIHLAREGFAVFNYSMIGYNEFEDLFPHRFDNPTQQLWGFSAAGLQTWNSLRALDFIAGLPFVDPDRIGMTGASGGATQTILLTAIDERIRAAVPVNMISAHFQGGCICENAPALRLNTNNIELGALAAPRPLLMVSTSGDWTTHTPEIEFPAVREIFGLFDAEDHVKNVHLDFPHNYNADSRSAMYAWFDQWLGDKTPPAPEGELQIPDTRLLRAPLPEKTISVDALFDNYRQSALQHLQDNKPVSWASLETYREMYQTPLHHALTVPFSVDPSAAIFSPANRSEASDAQLIVHGNDPQDLNRAHQLAQTLTNQGVLVALVNPFERVPGMVPPDSINYWTTYNPTTAQLRIEVVRAAAQALAERDDVLQVDLRGMGNAGPFTLLARSQLPFIRQTHVDMDGNAFDADADFLETYYIPLLRKAGDFRTAAALVFPSPLTLENLPAGSLKRWITELYAGPGASDRLTFLP